ncbi:FkbM family methyltransferase [Mucilaginibacter myungsuensis]|uniref:FkbM family methyltransferase n=1 Tax=Mucilaginibacter myungsuensis TaxID=649104 RepID=A0A929KXK2_9SPHI|nr:FkbM family methyltransferase [Mucilaginibacter myungsuensis]MBE9662350.1 FkbM family methyltransferase [Mucilaginibacter myungsuensis]MDN3599213.1 FkbM family methyltransferase [Mucilaginibacter myungsuensis]
MGLRRYFRERKKNKKGIKQVKVGNYQLLADNQHPIEDYLTKFNYYSRNLARIAKYIENKYPKYGIVDVGANIGDTIALLRSAGVDQFVYLIEGEASYFALLQRNLEQFTNAKCIFTFLSEQDVIEAGFVESDRGTAKMNLDEGKQTEVKKLDTVAVAEKFDTIKLLKTDTDGFDFKILRGSYNMIRKDKPVLFFEYDAAYLEELDPQGNNTLTNLQQMGYNTAIFYDNYGKLLISTTLSNTLQLQQLYTYMNNKDGAFPYYDVCLFHADDDALANEVIAKEMALYK